MSTPGNMGDDWLSFTNNGISLSLVLQTTGVAVLVLIVYKLVGLIMYMRHNWLTYKDYPGPKESHWLFGTFYYFPKENDARLQYFISLCEKYSKHGYIRIWDGFYKPVILLNNPQTMRSILKTEEPKETGFTGVYRLLIPWLGEGLLISAGQKWKRNRRLLTRAFHFDILKPYTDVYNDAAGVLVGILDTYSESGQRFELFQHVCNCSLQIILKCAFSYDKDVQTARGKDPYIAAVTELTYGFDDRVRRPYLWVDWIFALTPAGRKFKKNCDFVHRMAEDIIRKRQETLEKEGPTQSRKYLDFLDILLTARDETGNGLSPLEIRHEVDTFLFEGHDTTASGMSWILYSLAEHPEYQRKAQAEIDEILDGRDGDDNIQWDEIQKLEYLTMCVKEGLRLHSPVPMVGRRLTQDLDIGDRILPKGTAISVNMWSLHHNEQIWPNHNEYIPDRFTKENMAKMDSHQFVPFSAGPRNCIGQHFALNEQKVVIAKLLRNFTFELDKDHVVTKSMAAVMRAENGIYMYAKRRSQ